MALKGTLQDFGISEILQLIGHQHKSGTLVVTGPKQVVTVLFDSGQIVEVATKPTLPEQDLGVMMAKAGLLHPSQLEMAREQRKETLQPLELILIKNKAASLEDLREMKRLSHLEILYNLFLWKEGDYEFEAGPVNFLANLAIPISSEQVLMDGYRIKDEWPEVARQIPDLGVCFRRSPGDFSTEDRLEPEDDRIYRLVDGQRSVQDLVFISRRGKFETLKALVRLSEQGRVEAVKGSGAGLGRPASAWKRRRELIFYGVFGLLVLLLLNGFRLSLVRSGWLMSAAPGPENRLGLLAGYQTDRLTRGLEIYRLRYGETPARLDDLTKARLCQKKDLRFPWSFPYFYERTPEGFNLQSPVRSAPEAR